MTAADRDPRTSGEPDAGDVEALARALADDDADGYGDAMLSWDDMGDRLRGAYRQNARAVLAALPALGYRKAPSRSVHRRLQRTQQADPARVEAGQPQVVEELPAIPMSLARLDEPDGGASHLVALLRWGWACHVAGIAYAEQQRQAAVGDGQVVVTGTDDVGRPVSWARRDWIAQAAGPDQHGRVDVPDHYGDGGMYVLYRPDVKHAPLTLSTHGHWSIDMTLDSLLAAVADAGGPDLRAALTATRPDETREGT